MFEIDFKRLTMNNDFSVPWVKLLKKISGKELTNPLIIDNRSNFIFILILNVICFPVFSMKTFNVLIKVKNMVFNMYVKDHYKI